MSMRRRKTVYHLIMLDALESPPPKAVIAMMSPLFKPTFLFSSSSAIAMLAAEVLP